MIKTSRYFQSAMTITACLLMAACAKSSDNNDSDRRAVQPSEVVSAELAASGDAVSTFTTTGLMVTPAPQSLGELPATNEEIYAFHPILKEQTDFLSTISRAVETDAGTLDLYSGDDVAMTLVWQAETGMYTVRDPSNFRVDSIQRTMGTVDASQEAEMEKLTFVISSCRTVTEQPAEQEQKQEDKEEAKDVEYCSAIVAEMSLDKVVQQQEQEQDKVDEKVDVKE